MTSIQTGIQLILTFVKVSMRDSISNNEADSAKLYAQYEAAWRRFVIAVNRCQFLEESVPPHEAALFEAQAAVQLAEEAYREARNALADDLREHSGRARPLVACQC